MTSLTMRKKLSGDMKMPAHGEAVMPRFFPEQNIK
jgi:hypothetical protein